MIFNDNFSIFRREMYVIQGDRDTYIGNNTIDYVQERRIGRSRYRVPYRDLNKCMCEFSGLNGVLDGFFFLQSL